jgi:hypothetical protein
LKGRERVIEQRLGHCPAAVREIKLDNLKTEGFFGGEMVGEGPLWHSGCPDDVANAGAGKAALMDDLETGGKDFLSV